MGGGGGFVIIVIVVVVRGGVLFGFFSFGVMVDGEFGIFAEGFVDY